MGGNAEAPSSSFPPPRSCASLSAGRLFPPPLSSPPSCSSLRGQGSPPPPDRRAGGSRINPPPTRTFPPSPPPPPPGLHRLDFARGEGASPPPARLPRRNPARGGDEEGGGRGPGAAVQTCFLPPAAAAARAPMCGCVPRPAHPPHLPARRVGAALKGLGVGLRRQGIGAEEGGGGGAGVRSAVGSVTCVPLTPRLPQAPGLPGPGGSRNLASPGEGTKAPRLPRLVFPLCYGPWLDGTCRATATLPGVPVACWFSGERERPERPPGRSVFSDCEPLSAPPSDHPPSRRFSTPPWLFPTSCFLPGSGAIEVCLEWGRC